MSHTAAAYGTPAEDSLWLADAPVGEDWTQGRREGTVFAQESRDQSWGLQPDLQGRGDQPVTAPSPARGRLGILPALLRATGTSGH